MNNCETNSILVRKFTNINIFFSNFFAFENVIVRLSVELQVVVILVHLK